MGPNAHLVQYERLLSGAEQAQYSHAKPQMVSADSRVSVGRFGVYRSDGQHGLCLSGFI